MRFFFMSDFLFKEKYNTFAGRIYAGGQYVAHSRVGFRTY